MAGRIMHLDADTIRQRLSELEGWTREGDTIRKTYRFEDFRASMAFVNAVAELAEALDHHPDIFVSYATVTLTLTTHDAGGLSERDFELARRIDG